MGCVSFMEGTIDFDVKMGNSTKFYKKKKTSSGMKINDGYEIAPNSIKFKHLAMESPVMIVPAS